MTDRAVRSTPVCGPSTTKRLGPVRGYGTHHEQIGFEAAEDEALLPRDAPAVAGGLGRRPVGLRAALCGVFVGRQGTDDVPRRDAGQMRQTGAFVTGLQQRVRRQDDAREVRAANEETTQLREHDSLIAQRRSAAAVLLGNRQPGKAELAGQLIPKPAVETIVGNHRGADRGLVRLALEERPDGLAKRLLLIADDKAHLRLISSFLPKPGAVPRALPGKESSCPDPPRGEARARVRR